MSLKVYEEEWHNYSDLYDMYTSTTSTKKIVQKLTRHFKIYTVNNIYFTKRRKASASRYGRYIVFSKDKVCLGLIAHEVAHHLAWKRFPRKDVKHCRKFKSSMKIVVKYIRKKNMWKDKFTYKVGRKINENRKRNS
jgi:predicted SprT family Zn-dependent metalloprotease